MCGVVEVKPNNFQYAVLKVNCLGRCGLGLVFLFLPLFFRSQQSAGSRHVHGIRCPVELVASEFGVL